MSQGHLERVTGISQEQISRIERAVLESLSFEQAMRLGEALGLELGVRLYPATKPVRDSAHVRLLEELRARLDPRLPWRTEVPLELRGDLRAWDAATSADGRRIGIDAETRLYDFQAVDRRLTLKKRDSQFDRAVLLVQDTRTNRNVLRSLGPAVAAAYPVSSVRALLALAAGRDPGGDAIIVL
jgi:transcriptional regulator with XRE-family HTH domain